MLSLTFSSRQPQGITSASTMKSVAEYLSYARQFDRLATIEPRVDVKQLLNAQADTCYRLAERRARETNAPIPPRRLDCVS